MAVASTDANEVREKLLSYARIEAEKIIREAEEHAKRIIEDSEREWSRRYQEFKAQELKRIRVKASQIESEARLKARLLMSRAKEEVIEGLFREVEGALVNRGFDVARSLEVLLAKSLEELGSRPKRVMVSSKDVELAKDLLKKMGIEGVLVEGSPTMIGGVIVENENGDVVDNSYETRLSRIKDGLLYRIRGILWEGKGT